MRLLRPPSTLGRLIKYLILFVLIAGIVLVGLTLLKVRSQGEPPTARRKRPPTTKPGF